MSTSETIHGSCLCGAVKYQVSLPLKLFQYCHCSQCQKVTGSNHAANIFIKPDQLTWTQGEESLQRFEMPGKRYFATTFCQHCGSNLPWLTQDGATVLIPAGTLDQDPAITPQQNIFYGSKAPWHISSSELPQHDTLPGK